LQIDGPVRGSGYDPGDQNTTDFASILNKPNMKAQLGVFEHVFVLPAGEK